MNQANENGWDMAIAEVLTFGLATLGIISLGALVWSYNPPTWLKVVLSIIGFIMWGYSAAYILTCSKLWRKHGNES